MLFGHSQVTFLGKGLRNSWLGWQMLHNQVQGVGKEMLIFRVCQIQCCLQTSTAFRVLAQSTIGMTLGRSGTIRVRTHELQLNTTLDHSNWRTKKEQEWHHKQKPGKEERVENHYSHSNSSPHFSPKGPCSRNQRFVYYAVFSFLVIKVKRSSEASICSV